MQKLITKTPKNLKVLDVMVNVARFFNILKRREFEEADGNKYDMRKRVINCNTDFTVYKFHCSSCSKEYIGSNMTDFCYWFSKYKSAFRKISKSIKAPNVNQLHFHQHFKLPEHNGMDDWRVTLIDRADNRKILENGRVFGSINWTHSFLTG